MGIRVRYTGGESRKKRTFELSLPWKSAKSAKVTKGEVFDLPKMWADELFRTYPLDFERVKSGEDGYDDAQPLTTFDTKPHTTPVEEQRGEKRSAKRVAQEATEGEQEWVTLRALRSTAIANNPYNPAEKVVITEGETFRVHPVSAAHYMLHLPDHFEQEEEGE